MFENQSLKSTRRDGWTILFGKKTLVFHSYILKFFLMFVIHKVKDVCGKTFLKKNLEKKKNYYIFVPDIKSFNF